MGHIMNESARDKKGGVTRDRSSELKSVSTGAHCSRFSDRLKGFYGVKQIRSQHSHRITHFKKQRCCSEHTDHKVCSAEGVTLFLTAVAMPENIEHTACNAESGLYNQSFNRTCYSGSFN